MSKTVDILKAISKINKKEKSDKQRVYDPKEQLEGYKKRIEGSGIDLEKATDKRSFIEKALNLPDDQNPLFDLFEIINRPQQALFGAVKAGQEGEDIGKAALAGIKGDTEINFKEILHNAGMEKTDGSLGLDDILGFAGDVFVDPVDFALIPVTAASKVSKLTKATNVLTDAEKALDAAKGAADTTQDVLIKLQRNVNKAKKGLDAAKVYQTKKVTSPIELFMSATGTGLKGAFRFADTGIEKFLTYFDNYSDTLMSKMSKELYSSRESLKTLKYYTDMKTMLRKTFNIIDELPENIFGIARKVRGKQHVTKKAALKYYDEFLKSPKGGKAMEKIAADLGISVDEVSRALSVAYQRGNNVLSKDGKITLEGIRHKTTIKGIINDDALLHQQGLMDVDAKRVEDWVKEWLPNWYRDKVENMNKTLFRRYTDDTGKVVATNRIYDDDVLKSLKEELAILDNDPSLILKKPKTEFKDLPSDLTKREKTIHERLNYYMNLEKKGVRRVIPLDTAQGAKFRKLSDNIAEKEKQLKGILKNIEKNPNVSAKTAKARADKIIELKKDIQHFYDITSKVWIKKHGVDVSKEIQKTANILNEQLGKGLDASFALGRANIEFEIGNYFTDETLKNMEKIFNHEMTPDLLNEVGDFMHKSVKTITNVMEANITETPGYLAHVLNDDWKKLNINKYYKKAGDQDTWGSTNNLVGNVRSFAERRYKTTEMEANALSKSYFDYLIDTQKNLSELEVKKLKDSKLIDMFSEDISTSFVDFINKGTKAVGDAQMLAQVLAKSMVDESTGFVKIRNAGDVRPVGYTEITVASLKGKLQGMEKFLNLEDGTAKKALSWLEKHSNDKLFIDNNINAMIGKITDKTEPVAFLEVMNGITNIFKRNKLLSPGFQLRNIVGNMSNMWLSGMPLNDIMSYTKRADGILKKGNELFDKVHGVLNGNADLLSKAEREIYDEFVEFAGHGFTEVANNLQDLPREWWDESLRINMYQANKDAKTLGEKAQRELGRPKEYYDRLTAYNMKKNAAYDQRFRLAMYKYAKDNPNYLVKYGHNNPESAVRAALFDFQDLSVAERQVLRKFIPFYTFTKKNLAFQMNNISKNSVKYNQMIKAFNNFWDTLDLEDDEMDRFKLENFWIPIPFRDKDGKYKAIKSSLPLGDLGEFLDDPLRRILSATSPIIRAPFEMATNKQIFSDMPVEEFKGQKGFYIPEISRKAEFGLSQLGLDVPAAAGFDIGRTVAGIAKGNVKNPLEAMESSVGRTLLSTGDPAKTQEREAYNDLDDIQNLMRYYKQEGIEIKTIAELSNSQKFKGQEAIIQRIKMLRGK